MSREPTLIVEKITDGVDPKDVLCTTYQMRDMYRQMGDGLVRSLEVMNFIQHHKAALVASSGDTVLDVCCGRGLMLPLLRWFRPKIKKYIGVDIEPKNFDAATKLKGVTRIDKLRLAPNWVGVGDPTYPFDIHYVHSNVANMSEPLKVMELTPVDYVIYTASIEHMQREAGVESLRQCYKVMRKGAKMFLSSPNTSSKQDPYDTQYAAHLYEWPRSELLEGVRGSVISKNITNF